MVNSRKVNDEFNIFKGVQKNKWFMIIWACEVVVSAVIVQFSGRIFNLCSYGLMWHQWLIALAFAFFLLPLRAIICKVPERCFPKGIALEHN
jgi:hypothetical protein